MLYQLIMLLKGLFPDLQNINRKWTKLDMNEDYSTFYLVQFPQSNELPDKLN